MPKTNKLIPTIGIECHVQLRTETKLFSAVANDARQAPANTLISHICMGMPGALPVLNEKAVEFAMRMGFAFNTVPRRRSYFERKHYFYPDLPKGYQITQLHEPIVKGGYVEINIDGQTRRIKLNRVQIEEDAGKSTHPAGKDYSLVDLNRAGTPLLEIVSEPDMSTPAEAKAYARELYLLARFTGVSDADMYHGNMRFDVNVSLSDDPAKLGVRTETKNLNSFRSVEKAVEFEIKRQAELLRAGKTVIQETRGWDEAKQKTVPQRGKEEAHDYRYFPEPDIPPLVLSREKIESVRGSMPVLPSEWRRRLTDLGLDSSATDVLLEAEVDHADTSYLALIESKLADKAEAKKLTDWLINIEIPMRRDGSARSELTNHERSGFYEAVYRLITAGKLSSTNAKALIATVLGRHVRVESWEAYAEQQGFIQVSDEAEIEKIVETVLADNPKAAEDLKAGETKIIGFLIGQVMKASAGKANPALARKLIKEKLSI